MLLTREKPWYSEKYLCQCHFFHHGSHVHSPGIETEPPLFYFSLPLVLLVDQKLFSILLALNLAQAVLVCMRKLLETSVLTGIFSYIHFLFFSVLFLVYYHFFYFLAFLCVFSVNIRTTSVLFCNFNTSDAADVSV